MIRQWFTVPVAALAVWAIAPISGFGQAAPTPGKVGVIEVQRAMIGTKDGQKAAADLETRFGGRRKELERVQDEIRGMQDRLQKMGNTATEAAKEDLKRDIDARTKQFNRKTEDAQAEFEQEQQKLLADLGQRMQAVIDKYAKDNGYTLILDVSNPQTPVLYASNTIDITKDIIELYDKNAAAAPAAAKPSPTSAAPPKPTTPAKPAAVPAAKKQP
ncbi:MAG: OmpH family outer membrane protein [Bryobacteraceae bacterium]